MAYPEQFTLELTDAVRRGLDVRALRATLRPALDELLADPRVRRAERLVLTGSGDSLFAATCDPARAPPVVRAIGRGPHVARAGPLRGAAPRPGRRGSRQSPTRAAPPGRARAMLLARERGALTVAVTREPERAPWRRSRTGWCTGRSGARKASTRPTRASISTWSSTSPPSSRSTRWASRWAVRAGRLSPADARRPGSTGSRRRSPRSARSRARSSRPSRPWPRELGGADTIWVIGGGPNRGTARLRRREVPRAAPLERDRPGPGGVGPPPVLPHARLEGAVGRASCWRRRATRSTGPRSWSRGSPAPGGAPSSSAIPRPGDFPRAHARLDLPGETPELLTPVTYHVPTQLLVLHLARLAGVPVTPLRRQDDYWLIRKGAVRETSRGLA